MLHNRTCNTCADACRYVFTRVPSSSTGSPQQGSTSKKRAREEAAPTSPASKRHQSPPAAPAPAVDAGALQKLRKSNDVRIHPMRISVCLYASITIAECLPASVSRVVCRHAEGTLRHIHVFSMGSGEVWFGNVQELRKKLQEERQAKEAAMTKAQTFAAEVHIQQAAAAQSADKALAEVRNFPSQAYNSKQCCRQKYAVISLVHISSHIVLQLYHAHSDITAHVKE